MKIPKTKVIYRVFRNDGQVVALFPEVPGDMHLDHCESYMAIGQHGPASVNLSRYTRPATKEEIEPLSRELSSIGYNLHPVSRVSQKMNRERIATLRSY